MEARTHNTSIDILEHYGQSLTGDLYIQVLSVSVDIFSGLHQFMVSTSRRELLGRPVEV